MSNKHSQAYLVEKFGQSKCKKSVPLKPNGKIANDAPKNKNGVVVTKPFKAI